MEAILTSLVNEGGQAVTEPVSFEGTGEQQALVEDLASGSYTLQITSVERDYAYAVYECKDEGGAAPRPQRDDTRHEEQAPPADTPSAPAPPAETSPPPPTELSSPSADELTPVAPDEPIPDEVINQSMPTRQTPEGPVVLLPDTAGGAESQANGAELPATGGPSVASVLRLGLGCLMISFGSFLFLALGTTERSRSPGTASLFGERHSRRL